jgi:hypothetical protein
MRGRLTGEAAGWRGCTAGPGSAADGFEKTRSVNTALAANLGH